MDILGLIYYFCQTSEQFTADDSLQWWIIKSVIHTASSGAGVATEVVINNCSSGLDLSCSPGIYFNLIHIINIVQGICLM